MSYFNGPKIVTDGLVLCLDAANSKSYIGSGTTWTDISYNALNGTLTNTPTFTGSFGGGFYFNGTNQYVTTPSFSLTGPYTIIVSAKSATSTWNDYGILCSRRVNSGFVLHPQQSTKDVTCYFTDSAGSSLYGGNLTPADITINHVYAMSTNGSNIHYGYLDDTKPVSNTTAITTGTSTGQAYIAKDSGISRYGNVTIYECLIYNRQLTDGEYLQTYNALKTRFGL